MDALHELRRYLAARAAVDPARVTTEARLEDLGVDSLTLIELTFALEDRFDVRVPDTGTLPGTVGELVSLIESLVAQRQPAGT